MVKPALSTPPHAPQVRGYSRILNVFSSVWLGIALLVLIFVYSSLGSAYQPIRVWTEMTEMEWFGWWPFSTLVGLMCLNIAVVTVRRIPLRLINAGVWTIHCGILVLCTGSVYYFTTKEEGDIPVFRRRVEILLPGVAQRGEMLIRPGNRVTIPSPDGDYFFRVADIALDWPILSDEHRGETAYAVWINVQTPTQTFTRQLIDGFPQYTEDLLANGRRAKKELGRALVDASLDIRLAYEPQDRFYLMHTAALYSRPVGTRNWFARDVPGFPHFREHVADPTDVLVAPGERPLPSRPLDMALPAAAEADPLAEYDVHVTGFLRYAHMVDTWYSGGAALNPVLRASVRWSAEQQPTRYELAAGERHDADGGRVAFRWAESAAEVDRLVTEGEGRLTVSIPDTDIGDAFTVSDLQTVSHPPTDDEHSPEDHLPPFRAIDGTDYSFRLKNVYERLQVPSGKLAGRAVSVAVVEIKTPQRTFTRWVADLPEATADMGDDHQRLTTDPGIDMTFTPSSLPQLTMLAGPDIDGLELIFNPGQGALVRRRAQVGVPIDLDPGVRVTVEELLTHAVRDNKPLVVPLHRRDKDAGSLFAMMRVRLSKPGSNGTWSRSTWLRFNHYAMPDEQYRIPNRIVYDPVPLTLPDGRQVELMYSRVRRPLPAPVVLEDFELLTHTGGYTGQTNTVRDFVSRLRFRDGDTWSEPVRMSLNLPATNRGYWFFQSTWDPPSGGAPGMNFTGMGVGNRNGVYIQLAGTIIAVTGMIFAFYVKPIIRRRRRMHQLSVSSAAAPTPSDDAAMRMPEMAAAGQD